jgi:putative oxidoreductase
MTRLKTVGIWVLQFLLAVVMVGPGMQKFTSPAWERMFRAWGYPDHFYLVIGAIEVVAGIGLLVPKVATASALALMMVMAGAAVTQITRGGRNGVGELVFVGLLAVIASARWRDAARPTRRASAPLPAR